MSVSASYGSFNMDGRPYVIDGPVSVEYAPELTTISMRVVVLADDPADLATKSQALEDAFVLRFQTIKVEFDNGTQWEHSHEENTGLNMTPFATKEGEPIDTGRSRAYTVGVAFQLPVDDTHPDGAAGRVEATIRVYEDTSLILHAEVMAIYTATAQPKRTAVGAAQANFQDFIDANLSLFAGTTWDEMPKDYQWDDQNKLCTAKTATRGLVFNETQTKLNDTRIIDAKIAFTRGLVGPGDTPSSRGTARLQSVVASYDCGIDRNQTTDLEGMFENVIKPHLVQTVRRLYKARYLAITHINPRYIRDVNRISVAVTFSISAASSVFQYVATQAMDIPPGRIWIPLMKGDPQERYEYQGPVGITRSTDITLVRVGSDPLSDVAGFGAVTVPGAGGQAPSIPGDASNNWRLVSYRRKSAPLRVGVVNNPNFDTTLETYNILEQYVKSPKGGVTTQGGSAQSPVAPPPGNPLAGLRAPGLGAVGLDQNANSGSGGGAPVPNSPNHGNWSGGPGSS